MHVTLNELRPIMASITSCVEQAYPLEGCGLVVEREGRLIARCCENRQDRLHAVDPGRYPRTAATAYDLDPLEIARAEASGERVLAVFHSHPDRGAYFSDVDALAALGGEPDGTPLWPDVRYLVLSARSDGVADARMYAFDADRRAFVEVG